MELSCIEIRLGWVDPGTLRGLSGLCQGGRVCTFARLVRIKAQCGPSGGIIGSRLCYGSLGLGRSLPLHLVRLNIALQKHGPEEKDCQVLSVKVSYLMLNGSAGYFCVYPG